MFRRLYWVVEQVNGEGHSKVTGVYTSIQDLIHRGLNWSSELGHNVRVTLLKPDVFDDNLGEWTTNEFDRMAEDLRPFIATNEMTDAEVADLMAAFNRFLAAAR